MRILVFNWKDAAHPDAGGAEVFTHGMARAWIEAGHEVTLVCSGAPGLAGDEVGEDGLRVKRRGSRLSVYAEARRWYRQEGAGRFDLVVDEVNTRPFLCPTFVRDVPVVGLIYQVAREIWFHEMPLPAAVVGRFWLEPRWLRHYRHVPVVTISESSRASLARYGLRDVEVVPVGLTEPPDVGAPARERRPTAVFVGRLAANKRPHQALAAFRQVKARLPDAQLWVVGTGPLEAALRRDAPPGVRFFGRVGERAKFELLSRAHALVATSVREGWGINVSEAAAVGTRTIGYDVPGLRDSIRASDGLVVAPTARALAEGMVRTLPVWQRGRLAPPPRGVATWPEVGAAVLRRFAQVHPLAVPRRP